MEEKGSTPEQQKDQEKKKALLPISIGETVGRKYRIRKKIASGGMADVFEAEQITLRRKVALKVLKDIFADSEDARTMFYREAQMVAQELDHPNIVKVYDFGEHKGRFYIVMYYVNGVTLDEYIQERGPLPVEEALKITVEILKALDYAHRKGIVHRDIKPGNIMLSTDGRVYLLDFGIADLVMQAQKRRRSIPGTPEYMAPEQFRDKVDHRSDIYSVGVLLYEMLTGKTPFALSDEEKDRVKKAVRDDKEEKDQTIWVLQRKIFSEVPPPPSSKNPEVPPQVDEIVMKAIHKMPSERFQSAYEFIQAILDTGLVKDETIQLENMEIPDRNLSVRGGYVQEEEVSGTKITQFIPIEEEGEAEFEFEEVEANPGRWKVYLLLIFVLFIIIAGIVALLFIL